MYWLGYRNSFSLAEESYLYHDYVKPEQTVYPAVDDSGDINHDENQVTTQLSAKQT